MKLKSIRSSIKNINTMLLKCKSEKCYCSYGYHGSNKDICIYCKIPSSDIYNTNRTCNVKHQAKLNLLKSKKRSLENLYKICKELTTKQKNIIFEYIKL